MLISVSPKQTGNSLYGDVDARLLDKIRAPDIEEWGRVAGVREGAGQHNKSRLMGLIDQHFFASESDHPTMEDKLAEAPALPHPSAVRGSGAAPLKVKQDPRKLAREIEADEAWYDTDYLAAQLALMFRRTACRHGRRPASGTELGLRAEPAAPLGFVRQYQQLQRDNASPEKLDNMRCAPASGTPAWLALHHDFLGTHFHRPHHSPTTPGFAGRCAICLAARHRQ